MRERLARPLFVGLLVVSLAMFLTPGRDVPTGGPNDKVVHLLIFVVLGAAGRWAGVRWQVLAVALPAYAALSEVLQAVLPIQRDGSLGDLLADVAGVAPGLLLTGRKVSAGADA